MAAPVHLSHLDELEAEAIHIMREVAAELERPVLLFSGGKDSIVLLRLAEKAFRPGKFPFPVMHVDTGHNFPEVHRVPRPARRRARRAADRRVGAGVDRQGPRGRGDRAARVAQPAADDDAARRDRGARVRRGDRRRPARRGTARAKERIFSLRDEFGQWDPRTQRPELWTSTTVASARASTCASSRSRTGRARRLAVHRPRETRAAVDLLRPRARGVPPRRDALRGTSSSSAWTARSRSPRRSGSARSAT